MLHKNTRFVDDVIVEFLKQSQRMVALSTLGFVEFVVRLTLFFRIGSIMPDPARTVASLTLPGKLPDTCKINFLVVNSWVVK